MHNPTHLHSKFLHLIGHQPQAQSTLQENKNQNPIRNLDAIPLSSVHLSRPITNHFCPCFAYALQERYFSSQNSAQQKRNPIPLLLLLLERERESAMDSDQGKLFIGGVSWETTEEKLKEHFENYGEVSQTVIMRDKNTGRPRGFGFVVFSDPSILDTVLQDRHTIDGRTVSRFLSYFFPSSPISRLE